MSGETLIHTWTGNFPEPVKPVSFEDNILKLNTKIRLSGEVTILNGDTVLIVNNKATAKLLMNFINLVAISDEYFKFLINV